MSRPTFQGGLSYGTLLDPLAVTAGAPLEQHLSMAEIRQYNQKSVGKLANSTAPPSIPGTFLAGILLGLMKYGADYFFVSIKHISPQTRHVQHEMTTSLRILFCTEEEFVTHQEER